MGKISGIEHQSHALIVHDIIDVEILFDSATWKVPLDNNYLVSFYCNKPHGNAVNTNISTTKS